jgi:hypothetical protein
MGGIDLVNQARADVGGLFSTNVGVGAIVLSLVMVLHILLLLPTSPKWRRAMSRAAPWLKWEMLILVTAYQGLLVSSFQMIGMDEPICKYAGLVVLAVPTLTVLTVIYLLVRYARPSSSRRLVAWDDVEGEWVSLSTLTPNGAQLVEDVVQVEGAPRKTARGRSRSAIRRERLMRRYHRDSIAAQLLEAHLEMLPQQVGAFTTAAQARSISRRLSTHLMESLAGDFLHRYAHLFDPYTSARGAWLTVPWMLGLQYALAAFLGLAVPFGGCDYEQVGALSSERCWRLPPKVHRLLHRTPCVCR